MADLSITAASVVASAKAKINRDYNAGATIARGDAVYLSGSTWAVGNVTDAAALTYGTVGIALNDAASGQPLAVATYDPEFTPGATLTEGEIYVLSASGATAPEADLASGDNVVVLYAATDTTKAVLNPIVSGGTIA